MKNKQVVVSMAMIAVASMLLSPLSAVADDSSFGTEDVGKNVQQSSDARRAQGYMEAEEQRNLLLRQSKADHSQVSTADAGAANPPTAWSDGTDTGVSKQSAAIDGVSSMEDGTVRGVNLTSYQAEKSAGVKFKDFNGKVLDDSGLMSLFKNSGVNYVLLKVAVNPADADGNSYGGGNPTLKNAILTAKAAQQAGLNVNIQFLFSDFYTSKTVQKLPKGWESDVKNVNALAKRVSEYTNSSISTMKSAGVTPNMITIGSEITSPYYEKNDDGTSVLQGGFLGQDNWKSMATLISAAGKVVRAQLPKATLVVGGATVKPVTTTSYVDMLKYYGVDYDAIGLAISAAWDDLDALAQTRAMVSEKYGKSLVALDVEYPFTPYDSDGQSNINGSSDILAAGGDVSPQGQASYMRKLYKAVVSSRNNAGGAGVFYGDATWIAVHPGTSNATWNWEEANTHGTGWASKYAAAYVDYAGNGGASRMDDAALFDDLGQPLQSLKMFAQLSAANAKDSDLVPAAGNPYETGDDTGASQEKASVQPVDTVTDDTIRGVDLSSYMSLIKAGVTYKNFDGKNEPLMKILSDNGVNWVRIRIFNDPYDENRNGYGGGNNDLTNGIAIAKEASKYGMKVLLDLHYSDFYASSWGLPKAWRGHSYDQLKTDVYDWTKEVLVKMKNAGVDVGMIQIGNEENSGLLNYTIDWSHNTGWDKFSGLLSSASKAVRDTSPKTQVAIHFMYTDSATANNALGQFKKYGVDYDVFGTSYYPFWSSGSDNTSVDKPMDALVKLEKVATQTYKKKFAVFEYSYPFTENDSDGMANNLSGPNTDKTNKYPYAVSVQGQADVIRDTLKTVTESDGGTDLGLGAFYWEPAWLAVVPGTNHWEVNKAYANDLGTGWASSYVQSFNPQDTSYSAWGASGWDNQAVFDDHGNPLQSLKAFKQVISQKHSSSVTKIPVYRVYNRYSGLHHYTTDKDECESLVKLGWRYEGVSFNSASGSADGAVAVYREYNPYDGNHNWTANLEEHRKLVRLGWHDEGLAWYAYPAGSKSGETVYRLYNPTPFAANAAGMGNGGGEHVYTTSEEEYQAVGRAGWHKEGAAWKGL